MINTLFLDRDGVINEVLMRDGTVSSPRHFSEFTVMPEFVAFYRQISKFKLRIFVVSNQPDVSRQLLPVEELEKMTAELKRQFKFDEIVYCTHDDSHQCSCRKPRPGMINDLLEKYQLSCKEAVFIGDTAKDVAAGKAAGVTTICLRRNYNADGLQAEFIVDRLVEVLDLIQFTDAAESL